MLFALTLLFLWFNSAFALFQRFVTRPRDRAVSIKIKHRTFNAELSPGHFFVTPYYSDWDSGSFGPQIFDVDGNLIWYGNHTVGARAIDAHPCLFGSAIKDHICFNDAVMVEQGGHSSGVVRVLDNTYTQVFVTNTTNNLRSPDVHEANTPDVSAGKTLIKDVYQRVPANLTTFDSLEQGFVLNGCFQEISVPSGSLVFQWCSLDHISLNSTRVYTRHSQHHQYNIPIAGFGGPRQPWDYFHINSIDKDDKGDYYVSARHTNGVYKVAGNSSPSGKAAGSVIWRLNDKYSNFTMRGEANSTAAFARQHHVRFLPNYTHPLTGQLYTSNETHTVLSLFDNASDGYWHSNASCSAAKILLLVNGTSASVRGVATLLHQVLQPDGSTAGSQGSTSILPNGNMLVGWGSLPRYSEHSPDGQLLYYASIEGGFQNYRISKTAWVGRPSTDPDIVAYAQHCGAESHIYVSWNGATEVTAWRFYASNETQSSASIRAQPDSHNIGHGKRRYLRGLSHTHTLENGRNTSVVHPQDANSKFYEVQGIPHEASQAFSNRRSQVQSRQIPAAIPKQGYETHVTLPLTLPFRWIYAVALDASGIELGRTRAVLLHVPPAEEACGQQRCDDWNYEYDEQRSKVQWCLKF